MNQVEAQLAQVQESIDTIGNKLFRKEPSLSDILKVQSFKIGTVRAVLWPTAPQNTNVEKSNSQQHTHTAIALCEDMLEAIKKNYTSSENVKVFDKRLKLIIAQQQ